MNRSLGRFGEEWAVGYLLRQGFTILERNVRYRAGEIDIVAREGAEVVFVEVKTRRTGRFGSPEESVTAERFGHLAAAIDEYLQDRHLEDAAYRVDVVAIELGPSGRVVAHRHLRAAGPPGT